MKKRSVDMPGRRSSLRNLLLPLTPLYRLALAFRETRLSHGWEPVRRLQFPVISIGNLSTGGAGKTPFATALAKALTARGYAVDVLSRGYGRKHEQPARVDPNGTPEEFGDEPLLIADEAEIPVYVASQRYQAGLLAETASDLPAGHDHIAANAPANAAQNATVLKGHDFSRAANTPKSARALAPEARFLHILDDGFQHRQLHRDIDILLLNREDWHDRLLPAGNLREPTNAALRAHVIAIPDTVPEFESEVRRWGWTGPVWRLRRHMDVPKIDGSVVAFCGIARPEQFFAGLQASGLRLARRIAFRDHHRYTPADIERLQAAAHSSGAAALLTTAKDYVRLAPLIASMHPPLPFLTAGLRIEILDQDAALDWLTNQLSAIA
jgi:tetraacyldisaccharide 4'-kinase